jgi:hypothetical protein
MSRFAGSATAGWTRQQAHFGRNDQANGLPQDPLKPAQGQGSRSSRRPSAHSHGLTRRPLTPGVQAAIKATPCVGVSHLDGHAMPATTCRSSTRVGAPGRLEAFGRRAGDARARAALESADRARPNPLRSCGARPDFNEGVSTRVSPTAPGSFSAPMHSETV